MRTILQFSFVLFFINCAVLSVAQLPMNNNSSIHINQNDTIICTGDSLVLSVVDTFSIDTFLVEQFTMTFPTAYSRYVQTTDSTKYIMKISGTYSKWASWQNQVLDAAYRSNNGTITQRSLPANYSGGALRPTPDVYNPQHVYNFEFMGNGTPIHFTFADSYYSDNWGSLNIEIYAIQTPFITWSTNDTSSMITVAPNQTTTYYATLMPDGSQDSITVTVADTFYINETQTLCQGGSLNIFGNSVNSAGTYCQTFLSTNGCYTKHCIAVIDTVQMLNPQVVNPTCEQYQNGSITLNPTGGTPPYSYQWNDNTTASALANLYGGNYSVTVTDVNGCSNIDTFMIGATNFITLSFATQHVDCNMPTGDIIATPIGGVAPFSYQWDTGDSTNQISNLVSNTYWVTVTDTMGCQAIQSAQILSVDTFEITGQTVDLACFGDANGAIQLFSNETIPFTCVWNDGDTSQNRNNLTAGNYSVTVTNNNGCVEILDTIIASPLALSNVNFSNITHACFANNGTLTASVGNGTPPIQYAWNNNATTSTISNLAPNNYVVTATDANGCTRIDSAEVYGSPTGDFNYQDTGLTVSFTNLSTDVQSHSWDFGDGNTSSQIHPTHIYASSGSYQVTLTVTNPCGSVSVIQTIVIINTNTNEAIENQSFKIYPNPTLGQVTIDYQGNSNGLETVDIFSANGQLVQQYHFNNQTQTTIYLNDLPNGIYIFRINGTINKRVIKMN